MNRGCLETRAILTALAALMSIAVSSCWHMRDETLAGENLLYAAAETTALKQFNEGLKYLASGDRDSAMGALGGAITYSDALIIGLPGNDESVERYARQHAAWDLRFQCLYWYLFISVIDRTDTSEHDVFQSLAKTVNSTLQHMRDHRDAVETSGYMTTAAISYYDRMLALREAEWEFLKGVMTRNGVLTHTDEKPITEEGKE